MGLEKQMVNDEALSLAPQAQSRGTIHVSGCVSRCHPYRCPGTTIAVLFIEAGSDLGP